VLNSIAPKQMQKSKMQGGATLKIEGGEFWISTNLVGGLAPTSARSRGTHRLFIRP
jgi:hypothetical protein